MRTWHRYCLTVVLILLASPVCAALNGLLLTPQNGQPARHLLVLLHGYGSNEQDLLPIADFLAADYAVVSLRAPIVLGGDHYAWYRAGDLSQSDIDVASGQVIVRVRQLQQQLAISPARTLLAGFSQGAVMGWNIAFHYPTSVGAIAIFSGHLPPSLPHTAPLGLLPSVFVGHGRADERIPLALDEQAVASAQRWGYSVAFHRYAQQGHTISSPELEDFKHWAQAFTPQTSD
ncbi:alpha/beta hydrolase [Rosenbergiella australiborealis]|uniref:alpha/beta hydrolase n=1 Tax=Rosenbergiella australiborealis TaxID=1544696 RepID=UPI001F4DE91E|nr:alpha/beta hydrolase-fold protein [Rosenbergiella australiborealis]